MLQAGNLIRAPDRLAGPALKGPLSSPSEDRFSKISD